MVSKPQVEPLESWELHAGRPLLVCGPCSAENEEQILATAEALAESCPVSLFRAGVWKGRTRPGGFDGVGKEGLEWLARVRETMGLPVATEVACAEHVRLAAEYGLDAVWIGARTTSSPFSVQEIAEALRGTSLMVFVKNPPSPDVELWLGAIERVHEAGVRRIAAVHRGFFRYKETAYRNPPDWQVPVELARRVPGLPLICDPSHMTGAASLVAGVAQEAMDLAYDGLMIESHIEPESALCDGDQQVTPSRLARILQDLTLPSPESSDVRFQAAVSRLRSRIDELDSRLLEILERRMEVAAEIAKEKLESNVTVLQASRWDETIQRLLAEGEARGLRPELVAGLFRAVHQESIETQRAVLEGSRKLGGTQSSDATSRVGEDRGRARAGLDGPQSGRSGLGAPASMGRSEGSRKREIRQARPRKEVACTSMARKGSGGGP